MNERPDDNEQPAVSSGVSEFRADRSLHSGLTEDQMLALVQRADVTAQALASFARNPEALKSRKVTLALAMHPRTPRHIAVPLLRRMFTFDLMQVTLTPAVAADIKRAGEEQLLRRRESLSIGEKISLARRASGRVAAALLQEADARVVEPALDNAQLTEALVVQALMKPRAPTILFELASEHRNWWLRREVQIALLRSEKTPIDRAKGFAENFSGEFLQEILPESRRDTLLQAIDPSTAVNSSTTEDAHSGDSK
jgi:hypothetical protein